jgi:hypothetical protein
MIGREALERRLKRKVSDEELAAVAAVMLHGIAADRRKLKRAIRKAIKACRRSGPKVR